MNTHVRAHPRSGQAPDYAEIKAALDAKLPWVELETQTPDTDDLLASVLNASADDRAHLQ